MHTGSLRAQLVGWAVTALAVLFGLQLLRVLIPTLVWYLRDTLGFSTLSLAPIALGLFGLSFLAGPLHRAAGLRPSLIFTVGGLALLRVVEQLTAQPLLDLFLSGAGLVLFLLYIPLGLGAARHWGSMGTTTFGFGILLGLTADTAIHTAAGTYDLSWQSVPASAMVILLAALLLLALRATMEEPALDAARDGSWAHTWPLVALGPWLFLQLVIFQNVARTAAVADWSLPAAGLLVLLGDVVGLVAAALVAGTAGALARWIALAAGLLLLLSLIPAGMATGPAAGILILVGSMLAALLVMNILAGSAPLRPAAAPTGLRRTTVAYGLGQILLVILLFATYASFDLPVGFRAAAVPPLAALLVGAAAAFVPREAAIGDERIYLPAALGLALLMIPLGLWLNWHPPLATRPTAENLTVRVMSYNLHNGFNTAGRLDLEALARVIEGGGADVVGLQEISRGWVNTGSLDMLSWLSQRLDMPYVSGPTGDLQWGNAILSRFPIISAEVHPLPPQSLLLRRGYIDATIDIGGDRLRVISTHLHHIEEEGPIREQQVPVLIEAWNGSPRTVIMGDLNATPEAREMVMLAEAGLMDVSAVLGEGPTYTYYSAEPTRQLDYIWISPDLAPSAFAIPSTTASDHLPLLVTLSLTAPQ